MPSDRLATPSPSSSLLNSQPSARLRETLLPAPRHPFHLPTTRLRQTPGYGVVAQTTKDPPSHWAAGLESSSFDWWSLYLTLLLPFKRRARETLAFHFLFLLHLGCGFALLREVSGFPHTEPESCSSH